MVKNKAQQTTATAPSPFLSQTDSEDIRRVLPLDPDAAKERRCHAHLAEEARLIEGLAHPGVPRLMSLNLSYNNGIDDRPSITLRLQRGVSLLEIARAVHADHARGRMGVAGGESWSFTGALTVFMRTVETVAYAHESNVLQRGIDPARIFVGRFGEVQLTDWRLARDLRSPDLHDLQPTAVVGQSLAADFTTIDGVELPAIPYLAPELLRGEQYQVGKAADVYALGAVLHLLLSGQAPYGESIQGAKAEDLRERVLGSTRRPLGQLARRAPRALVQVAERALSPHRRRRQADAVEFLREMEDAVARGIHASSPLVSLAAEHRVVAAAALITAGFFLVHNLGNDDGAQGLSTVAAAPPERLAPHQLAFVPRPAESREKDVNLTHLGNILPRPGAPESQAQPESQPDDQAESKPVAQDSDPITLTKTAGMAPIPQAAPPATPERITPRYGRDMARAVAARAAGHWEVATPLFRKVYRAQAEALGEDDSMTLRTRRELAACLGENGDREVALIHYYGCLALHRERDEFALDLQRELARLLLRMGEREEGENRLMEAAALAQELYGPDNEVSVELYGQVASSAFRDGELDRAAKVFELSLGPPATDGVPGQIAEMETESTEVAAGMPQASQSSPLRSSQRSTLVHIYQRLRRPAAALRHAQDLLDSTPEEHPARAARAALVSSLKRQLENK
ncbi:MAG: serine/threonine protein kinase/tetratricopeptide (TPR) repeat protein [Planctomycetota bacterium]